MKTKYFVIFDNEYNVLKVTTEVTDKDTFFEIPKEEAVGFSIGTKSLQSYFVKFSALGTYSLEEKKFEHINFMQNEIVEVLLTSDANLVISHSKKNKKWKFTLDDRSKNEINSDQYNRTLKFFIVKKDQPNNLIRTVELNLQSLINDEVTINFDTVKEENFTDVKVITKRYFNTIGIKDEP